MGAGKVEAAAQVLHQGLRLGGIVVKGNLLLQNGPVAGLPQVGGGTGNEPQRVIVEAGADVPIALFGQGLVLVVALPSSNWVAAISRMRSRAREGMMCTKPKRS